MAHETFATIEVDTMHNVYMVTLGAVLGHACCTVLAVVGGQYVSTKISVKRVTYMDPILFGLIYLYKGFVASAADSLPLPVGVPIDFPVNVPIGDGEGVSTR